MPKFLIMALATRETGYEHPSGGRPDITETKKHKLMEGFLANNAHDANIAAAHRVKNFMDGLPKAYPGSLSWAHEPKLKQVILSEVLPLSDANDIAGTLLETA